MYKMIVSAFENTLIDGGEAIDLSTMLEIDRIRKKNVLFVVSTSNSLDFILPYNRDLPFLDFVISHNGACLYDVNLEKIVFKKKLKASVVKSIINAFDNATIYVYTAFSRIRVSDYKSINDENKDILKMDIYNNNVGVKKILAQLKEMNLTINYCEANDGIESYVEVWTDEVDKVLALEKLCKRKRVKTIECGVIGGNISDYELVKRFGGSCVNNAPEKLKKVSKKNILLDDSKGVCQYLKDSIC